MLACGVQLPRETWDLNVIIEALLQTIIIAMHPPPLPPWNGQRSAIRFLQFIRCNCTRSNCIPTNARARSCGLWDQNYIPVFNQNTPFIAITVDRK